MLQLEKKLLMMVVTILCLLGVLFVYESSTVESFALSGDDLHFALTQAVGLVFGILAWYFASKLNYQWYLKFPYFFYLLALAVIGLCFWSGIPPIIKGNVIAGGARRWIWIFGVSVQVAEIVKFCVLIFFTYLLLKQNEVKIFLLYLMPIAGLILLQKDLGSLLVIFAVSVSIFFLSGAKAKQFIPLGLGLIGAILLMIVLSPYRMKRLLTYLNPQEGMQAESYHLNQALIAIGRGGVMGKGISGSIQKYYLPEASSDSIFPIIAEEIGFIGVSFILFLYLAFFCLLYRLVNLGCQHEGGKMIGYGIIMMFLSQLFLNLGAISGLIPLTGMPLPFLSAGGSSLVFSLFMLGVIFNLTKQTEIVKYKHRLYD